LKSHSQKLKDYTWQFGKVEVPNIDVSLPFWVICADRFFVYPSFGYDSCLRKKKKMSMQDKEKKKVLIM